MNLDTTHKGTRTFCVILFGLLSITGIGLYFFFGKGMFAGLGMSAGVISTISFFHFLLRKEKSKQVETKLTVLLLSGCLLGIALIFYNKFSGEQPFVYGVGGGISLIAGISYVMEIITNFKDNIR